MDLRTLVKEYLAEARVMQIATCVDAVPWVCTVCFAVDEKLNVYWFSEHAARHSQEIAANPTVAGAIVQPHTIGKPVRGLQFSGMASELKRPDDVRHALSCNATRYGVSAERVSNMQAKIESGGASYGVYQIRPTMFVLYDTLHFPASPRQELVLNNNQT